MARSRPCDPTSLVPCLTQRCMACRHCLVFVRLKSLPRMADFALWATACGTALWPAGTFAHAYDANRKAAVEGLIEMDPVAVCVRRLMAERGSWAGTASDCASPPIWPVTISRKKAADWPKHPGALAGPSASRADAPSHCGHRNILQPQRARGKHGQSG